MSLSIADMIRNSAANPPAKIITPTFDKEARIKELLEEEVKKTNARKLNRKNKGAKP